MSVEANAATERLEGPSPAASVALDMVKRGVPFIPVAMLIGAAFGGFEGAMSVLYGVAVVMINLLLSAALLAWASKISFAMVASVSLMGYVLRLGFVFLAVWLVKDQAWVSLISLGVTIIATHLGLLVWELRYVSASFAYPGLKPRTTTTRPVAAGRR
jgi:hypothetical protein